MRYSPRGQVRYPRRFIRGWIKDFAISGRVSRRLFLRHLAHHYRYSSLGLLWAFAPSAITAVVLIGNQRNNLVEHGTAVPGAFYAIFGLTMAQILLESIGSTRHLFLANQEVLRRQRAPMEGFILASLYDTGFNLVIRLSVLLAVFLLFTIRVSPIGMPLAVIGFIGITLIGAGLGLLMAPLCCLKKDIDRAFMVMPWILFAITPIFMPLPQGQLGELLKRWNPLVWLFEGIRAAAYGSEGDLTAAAWGLLIGLSLLFIGAIFCRIAQPHVIERMLG